MYVRVRTCVHTSYMYVLTIYVRTRYFLTIYYNSTDILQTNLIFSAQRTPRPPLPGNFSELKAALSEKFVCTFNHCAEVGPCRKHSPLAIVTAVRSTVVSLLYITLWTNKYPPTFPLFIVCFFFFAQLIARKQVLFFRREGRRPPDEKCMDRNKPVGVWCNATIFKNRSLCNTKLLIRTRTINTTSYTTTIITIWIQLLLSSLDGDHLATARPPPTPHEKSWSTGTHFYVLHKKNFFFRRKGHPRPETACWEKYEYVW